MTIIDSQVHAYEANMPKRPWHTVPNWPDHVTGRSCVERSAALPVVSPCRMQDLTSRGSPQ
jgi:hypothetical protein